MSYLVLARKYRPRNFESLVGQEHVVQALANALAGGRLHHAYLFTGTRGVGKTTVSRILAKSLNCIGIDGQGGVTAAPCGVCAACREIDAGRFVDYIELDAASNRGVDEIGLLLDQAVYKPVVGRFKVYMIDEVHMLTNHAFNAMLKTLEEPPDYLKFVLATTDPQKVPATVLSRCLQFNLRPMAPATIERHLVSVLADESVPADAGALRLLARAARGSMRDALSLADQAIAYGGGALAEPAVRQMLGAVDRSHALRIVQALAAGDGAALVAAADGVRDLGLSAAGTLEEVAGLLQQVALASTVPAALDDADPDTAAVRALTLAADETQLYYSIALHGRTELALAPDEHGGLVMVLLRMLAFRPVGAAVDAAAVPAVVMSPAGSSTAATKPVLTAPVVSQPGSVSAGAALAAASQGQRGGRPADMEPLVTAPATKALAVSAPAAVSRIAVLPARVQSSTVPPPRMPVEVTRAAPSAPRRSSDADEIPPWLDLDDANTATLVHDDRAVAMADAGLQIDAGVVAVAEDEVPSRRLVVAAPSAAPYGVAPAVDAVSDTTATAASVTAGDAPVTPAGDHWAALVGELTAAGRIGALVRELALQAQCLSFDQAARPARWRLRIEREVLRSTVCCERLRAALVLHLGHPLEIEIEAGVAVDSPALRDAVERQRRQQQAEQIIRDDPLVRTLLAQFKTARIVPGSVKPYG